MGYLPYFLFTLVLFAVAAHAYVVWHIQSLRMKERRLIDARRDFHYQRERLEAKFVYLAGDRYESNIWLWEDAMFDDEVIFAKNRFTDELTAYVTVTVERIRPNLMAALAHQVTNIRLATIVFHFDGKRWETDGRAVINLTPAETLELYKRELEPIDEQAVAAIAQA